MKLGQIGLYVLAGYGAYAMYERFLAGGGTAPAPVDATSSFTGTNWQRANYGGTYWQNQNNNFAGRGRRMKNMAGMPGYSKFTGTKWQQSGRDKTTNWQRKGVFQNACGGCA